jgi:hypothetical protein
MKGVVLFLSAYLVGVLFTALYFTMATHPSALNYCAGSMIGALLFLACKRLLQRFKVTL